MTNCLQHVMGNESSRVILPIQ